jgi:hypothetical protein
MSSPTLADRSHRLRSLGRRALLVALLIPLLVVASVLIGGVLPSQGAGGGRYLHQSSVSASSSTTTVPQVTTTTAVPPPVTTTTTPTQTTTTAPPVTINTPPAVTTTVTEPSGYGCADALAYLAANASPEFTFECPGYADGHAAMTCINNALCPGEHLIAIADPCAAAYMNEAYNSNSWSDTLGEFTRPIDPYGSC